MRAMILAAGRGQRLSPITDHCPKPLVPVLGKPLIVHQIERLKANGFDELVINVAYLKSQITELLGDGQAFGVSIAYSEEPWPALDVAGGVANALPLLGADPFLLVSCDIFTDFPYRKLQLCVPDVAHLVMVSNPNFHPKGDFGVKEGKLIAKTEENSFTYANIGVYHPKFFASIPQRVYPLSGLLQPAINAKCLEAEIYHGIWANVGTLKELHDLEQNLIAGQDKVKWASS